VKRLELLRELLPGVIRIAVLVDPANARTTESTLKELEAAVRTIGLPMEVINASTSPQIDAAFATTREQAARRPFCWDKPLPAQPPCPTGAIGGARCGSRHISRPRTCRGRRTDELERV